MNKKIQGWHLLYHLHVYFPHWQQILPVAKYFIGRKCEVLSMYCHMKALKPGQNHLK